MTKKKKRKKKKDLVQQSSSYGRLSVPPTVRGGDGKGGGRGVGGGERQEGEKDSNSKEVPNGSVGKSRKKQKRGRSTKELVVDQAANRNVDGGAERKDGNEDQEEQHGPHFKLPSSSFANSRPTTVNDEWQTTKESWQEISSVIKHYKKKCVWMPFYYDGKCGDYLRELGYSKVVHEKKDFFVRVKDPSFMKRVDFVLDNPPYTGQDLKERILIALVKSNKPFCLLLPSSVIFTKFLRDTLNMPLVQIIVPRKVHVRKTGRDQVPFKYLVWICYKMKLDKDLIFV